MARKRRRRNGPGPRAVGAAPSYSQYREAEVLERLMVALRGRSYLDMQAATGVSRETFRRQLLGIFKLSVEVVCALRDYLGVTTDWILLGADRGPRERPNGRRR